MAEKTKSGANSTTGTRVRKKAAPIKRCGWCGDDELYMAYHDEEWGVPVTGDQELFERLVLEGMQAGLAWITVLRKREHMQRVFYQFDIDKLARAKERQLQKWLNDAGIIRHRGKLEAMVGNAKLARDHEDFSGWLWSFAPKPKQGSRRSLADVPATTPESEAMSRALKKAGYRFVGPTICYAFMQSVGMVNDHVNTCWRREPCAKLQAKR